MGKPMYHTIYIAEHDLVSAQKLHATPRPLVAASLLALVLTGIASAYATGHLPLRAAIGAVAGISGLLALQFIVLIPYHARRKYQQRTFLHQLHHVRWDEECIHIRCGHT